MFFFSGETSNGDMALLQAMEKMLVDVDDRNPGTYIDYSFIQNHTQDRKNFCNTYVLWI